MSAQNLRQPLSGNKFQLLFLSILLLIGIQACKTYTYSGPTEIAADVIEEADASDVRTRDSIMLAELRDSMQELQVLDSIMAVDSVIEAIEFSRKDTYHIGMLLPFDADSIPALIALRTELEMRRRFKELDKHPFKLERHSQVAVDLFLGFLMGIEAEQENDKRYVLHLADKRAGEFKGISDSSFRQPVDLLIGPVYNRDIPAVADYCKSRGIANLSPMSPTRDLVKDNPFFYKMNPSLDRHLESIAEHIAGRDDLDSLNLVLICQKDLYEKRQATYLTRALSIADSTLSFKEKYIDLEDTRWKIDLEKLLAADKKNLVVIPSFDESFIQYVLTRLKKQSEDYPVILFGMPRWMEMASIRLDYLNALEFHFSSQHRMISPADSADVLFSKFVERFHINPSQAAYLGYDMAEFAKLQLSAYGSAFRFMDQQRAHSGILHDFRMEPVQLDRTNTIDYFESGQVLIYRISDYEIQALDK